MVAGFVAKEIDICLLARGIPNGGETQRGYLIDAGRRCSDDVGL